MLLNGMQPARSRLRILLLVAAGVLGTLLLVVWREGGAADVTGVVASWPAAVASHFSDRKGGGDAGTSTGTGTGTGIVTGTSISPIPPPPHPMLHAPTCTAGAAYFVLIGDSTTRGQASQGGGWGDAFLWLLARGAAGLNLGVNGALSTGYFQSPLWQDAMVDVRQKAASCRVYVTIQFGHNDQNPSSNITLDMYQEALVGMAREVLASGATPILVTPLARRDFDPDGTTVTDNLRDYRERTLLAHQQVRAGQTDGDRAARLVNLNAASLAYLGAIGKTAAYRYNLFSPLGIDTTHLNELGALVFARIVADLLLGHPPALVPSGQVDPWAPGRGNDDDGLSAWIRPDPHLTGLIWHGDAV